MQNKKNATLTIIIAIIIIGILARTIGITKMPNAINCDEASAGYEAFSILKYGIDRNGNKLPVFLVSWGSGQNALLTYILIPFIMILGLNILSIRLPMMILGCISLLIMYLLLKKISNQKYAIIGLAFFAICPWHIMKSRWGLESNLFPDLVLIFTYLLILGIENKNKIIYYISFVILGLTAYSYGTSYYFLPAFVIPLLIILVKKEKISIKQAIISLSIVAVVALPIILYVIINTLGLEQINLPFMTIPKLQVNRYKELTSIFSGQFIQSSITNFIDSIKILVLQYDELLWNALPGVGTIYIYSTFFTMIGIIDSYKNKKEVEVKYNFIFNIWFIVSIIMSFICAPNINRLNIIMIPIIYYTIKGIYLCIKDSKKIAIGVTIIYLISFGIFIRKYSNQECDNYGTFASGIEDVIKYVDQIEDKEIYFDKTINYIDVLFYTKYNTKEFVDTVKYQNKYVEFREVDSFGKYKFQNVEEIQPQNVYVIRKERREKYNLENYKVTEFEKYIVVE